MHVTSPCKVTAAMAVMLMMVSFTFPFMYSFLRVLTDEKTGCLEAESTLVSGGEGPGAQGRNLPERRGHLS